MDADNKVNPSDYACFKFQKKVVTRKHHRTGHKTIYKYTMQDLDDIIDAKMMLMATKLFHLIIMMQ